MLINSIATAIHGLHLQTISNIGIPSHLLVTIPIKRSGTCVVDLASLLPLHLWLLGYAVSLFANIFTVNGLTIRGLGSCLMHRMKS